MNVVVCIMLVNAYTNILYVDIVNAIDTETIRDPQNSAQDETSNDLSYKKSNRDLNFTDFILEVALVLKTYDDSVLEEVFMILDDELWKNLHTGCKSLDLAEVKKYVSYQLKQLKNTPAETLRIHLDNIINIIKKEDYGHMVDLVNFVDSMYVRQNYKFTKILVALMFKRISPKLDLADVIRRAIKTLVSDPYCKLDVDDTRKLIQMIKHHWIQLDHQSGNDEIEDSNIKEPYVTPFNYGSLGKKHHKKRRFQTVKEAQTDLQDDGSNEKNETDSAKRSQSKRKIFLSSVEVLKYLEGMKRVSDATEKTNSRSRTTQNKLNRYRAKINKEMDKNSDCESIETLETDTADQAVADETDKVNDDVQLNIPTDTQNASQQNGALNIQKLLNIKALAEEINEIMASEHSMIRRKGQDPLELPDVFKEETLRRNVTVNVHPHNNTIQTILNIGMLAKDITDMVASKNNRRQVDATDLQSVLNLPLDGVKSEKHELIKKEKEKDSKGRDIVIKMNLKYNE